jgi:hypothetical protein
MTRAELLKRLRATAESMDSTADSLDFYGGSADGVMHAAQLAKAAKIVSKWAEELEKENA